MHSRVFAERNAIAQERLISASSFLAEKFNLDPNIVKSLKNPPKADSEVRLLFQREAIADILESIVQAALVEPSEPQSPEPESPSAPEEPSEPHKPSRKKSKAES